MLLERRDTVKIASNHQQRAVHLTGGGNGDMFLWRLDTDGNLDTDFSDDGYFNHDSAAGGFDSDIGESIVIDHEGRINIGGFSRNASGNNDAVGWRFQ